MGLRNICDDCITGLNVNKKKINRLYHQNTQNSHNLRNAKQIEYTDLTVHKKTKKRKKFYVAQIITFQNVIEKKA